jgi:hypothetical protein
VLNSAVLVAGCHRQGSAGGPGVATAPLFLTARATPEFKFGNCQNGLGENNREKHGEKGLNAGGGNDGSARSATIGKTGGVERSDETLKGA